MLQTLVYVYNTIAIYIRGAFWGLQFGQGCYNLTTSDREIERARQLEGTSGKKRSNKGLAVFLFPLVTTACARFPKTLFILSCLAIQVIVLNLSQRAR